MINTSIVWDHRARTGKGKEGPIEVRVTVDRKPYYINTGVRVRKNEWKFGAIVNRPDCLELTERVLIITRRIEEEVNLCIKDNRAIDVADIRRKVMLLQEEQQSEPFLDWCYNQTQKMSMAIGTRKHYQTLMSRLSDFGVMKKWADVTVENIREFDMWLHRQQKPQTEAQRLAKVPAEYLSDGACYNHHKCLKKLLYDAEKIGKIERNPYVRLRGEFSRGEKESVEYLTDDEIDAIIALDLPVGSHLCMIRDLFVVQIFTGMAYVDLMNFNINDYKCIDGRWVHNAERVKTGVAFIGHLLPPVVEVLERYGMQLPRITNQKYNRSLKEIGELARIKTHMHTHLARHTFATYMLKHGVKIENLQRMMGHSDIQRTQKYAKTLAESVHEEYNMIEASMKKGKKRGVI